MPIKQNFIYNSILTLSQYIIAIIVFPYVSRVLGVNNIGIVGFIDNTINYFSLFALMGINLVGVREVAKSKFDDQELSLTYSKLLYLTGVLTTIVLCIYIVVILTVPQFKDYKTLFYIGVAKLISLSFVIEWFYRGVEKFKYIAVRGCVVKLLYVLLVFFLVIEKEDYIIYFILTVLMFVVNTVINILYARKWVRFSFACCWKINSLLKQVLVLGVYSILTSMYTTFNVMYLGLVSTTTQVGYYFTALKIYTIILGLFSAFTGAVMPRMSSLLAQNNRSEFDRIINISFNILVTFCVPIVIVSILIAPQIIELLSGTGYKGAILPMQIIMPLVLVVGVSQILVHQVLIPMRLDKIVLHASIIGCFTGLLFNVLFVEIYGSIGTAFVLVSSELLVTLYYVYKICQSKIVQIPWKLFLCNFLGAVPYLIVYYFCAELFYSFWTMLVSFLFASAVLFFVIQILFLKNEIILNLFHIKIINK